MALVRQSALQWPHWGSKMWAKAWRTAKCETSVLLQLQLVSWGVACSCKWSPGTSKYQIGHLSKQRFRSMALKIQHVMYCSFFGRWNHLFGTDGYLRFSPIYPNLSPPHAEALSAEARTVWVRFPEPSRKKILQPSGVPQNHPFASCLRDTIGRWLFLLDTFGSLLFKGSDLDGLSESIFSSDSHDFFCGSNVYRVSCFRDVPAFESSRPDRWSKQLKGLGTSIHCQQASKKWTRKNRPYRNAEKCFKYPWSFFDLVREWIGFAEPASWKGSLHTPNPDCFVAWPNWPGEHQRRSNPSWQWKATFRPSQLQMVIWWSFQTVQTSFIYSGWCFGTFLFSHILGIIIQID